MTDFIDQIIESTPLQLLILLISAIVLDLVIRRVVRRAVKRAVAKADARRYDVQPVATSTAALSVLRISERTKQRAAAI